MCELEKRAMRSIMVYRWFATVSICEVFPPIEIATNAMLVGVAGERLLLGICGAMKALLAH